MKGGTKYYVVVHGKCPGIYDSWDRVQQNIKDFPGGGEYCSKKNKQEAVEFFHKKRPDWPKQNIPDFTLHASNRLTPIDSKKLSAKSLEGSDRDQQALYRRNRSHSLTSKLASIETGER